jgi:MGT family glycosyltransferase
MEKLHVAVFTPFVGGHVYPALGLCSELVRRGHRVTYPSNEGFAGRIREAGALPVEFETPVVAHAEEKMRQATSDDSSYWREFTSVTGPTTIATAAAAVAELKEFYATNPPDVILYDWFAFAGRILARQLGCPAIQVHSHFAHHDSLMRIDGVCTTPEPMVEFSRSLDSFMSTYGFEDRDHLWHYEKLNIFLVPREFQYDVESFDRRFKFVGATHNRKPRPGLWKNRASVGQPLLLISEPTSSTDGSFLRLCMEAFAESKHHVVFSKALNSPEVSSASLPRNFEINRAAFNCEILPFTNVMLCQGGMGTTLESLYHGVPVVSLPPNPFNAEVAYRLAELGLGIHVRQERQTLDKLREAVDVACSDAALLGRVKRMHSDLASSPGAEGAADCIEEYLGAIRS